MCEYERLESELSLVLLKYLTSSFPFKGDDLEGRTRTRTVNATNDYLRIILGQAVQAYLPTCPQIGHLHYQFHRRIMVCQR